MNQSKTTSYFRWVLLISLSAVTLACAPKKQGVRAAVKTGQTSLNPGASAVAEQQASAQNAIYKIASVSLPSPTDYGVTISADLLTPNNQYLPITTSHESGRLDSEGVFNDSARGLLVYVNSRCSDYTCNKYMLLVTVTRNNQAIFQSGAISFQEDCNFYSIANTATTGQMFRSMDEFDSRYAGLSPIGDSTSCLQ